MPSRSELQRAREVFARESERLANVRILAIERTVLSAVIELADVIELDGNGRIIFTVSNISKADGIGFRVQRIERRQGLRFSTWVASRLRNLFKLNSAYIRTMTRLSERVERSSLNKLMAAYGYNIGTGRLVSGGYLASITTTSTTGEVIARRIANGVASRIEMATLKAQLRGLLVDPEGTGFIERHYSRFTFDLFQEFDRTTQMELAREVDLKYAIYSGTIMENTRPFCEKRNNRIYTSDEIESWNELDWKGKKPGVDVKIALGGYNCRHHLSYLSEGAARRIAKNSGKPLNSFNP